MILQLAETDIASCRNFDRLKRAYHFLRFQFALEIVEKAPICAFGDDPLGT
jgi:hypothetical protein